MSVTGQASCRFGFLALSTLLSMSVAQAAVVSIKTDVADYEPRLTRPSGSPAGQQLAIDSNIANPRDAANVRVGGQSRFRIATAYFFQLPTLNPGDVINSAHLSFTQIADSATAGTTPAFNGDLWAVGLTGNSTTPPAPDVAMSTALYNDADTDLNPGLNTTVPRLKVQDNFLTPSMYIANGGASATRDSSALGDTALLGYINSLYATGTPAGSYLVIRLNPDAPPDDTLTNRYQIASLPPTPTADQLAQAATLTLDITQAPEPASLGMLALAGVALLSRGKRALN